MNCLVNFELKIKTYFIINEILKKHSLHEVSQNFLRISKLKTI